MKKFFLCQLPVFQDIFTDFQKKFSIYVFSPMSKKFIHPYLFIKQQILIEAETLNITVLEGIDGLKDQPDAVKHVPRQSIDAGSMQ
jgi:hypothetical protein